MNNPEPLLPPWDVLVPHNTQSSINIAAPPLVHPKVVQHIPHPEMQNWAPGLAAACHRGTVALWHSQTSWSGTARAHSTTPGSRSSRSCPKRGRGTLRSATPATLMVSRPKKPLHLNKNTACFHLKGWRVWASLVEPHPRGPPYPSASLRAGQWGVVLPGADMGTGIL